MAVMLALVSFPFLRKQAHEPMVEAAA
jgi:hypothetical protein